MSLKYRWLAQRIVLFRIEDEVRSEVAEELSQL
jgi:hypothetical protein